MPVAVVLPTSTAIGFPSPIAPSQIVLSRVPIGLLLSRSTAPSPPATFIRPKTECPAQLETLTPLMLRDLPSYANRVSQRAAPQYRPTERPSYIVFAGRPEYQPLSLATGEQRSALDPAISSTPENIPQVFFTTLERQPFSGKFIALQQYHWLFLTQTPAGWRFVLMLSTNGDERPGQPLAPPRDSSQGVLAQAIQIWLRDCQTGNISL